jgi:hypothetical protein
MTEKRMSFMSNTKFLRDTAERWPNQADVRERAMRDNFDLSLNEIVEMANPRQPKPNDDRYLSDVRKWLLVCLRQGRLYRDPHSRAFLLVRAKLTVLAMVRRSREERAQKLASLTTGFGLAPTDRETTSIV